MYKGIIIIEQLKCLRLYILSKYRVPSHLNHLGMFLYNGVTNRYLHLAVHLHGHHRRGDLTESFLDIVLD